MLLDPIRKGLLSPERVQHMAKECELRMMNTCVQFRCERWSDRRNCKLNARIERLRARLNRGDPDMTADEIQAAIERAEAASTPAMKAFTMLSRAAETYRRQSRLASKASPERHLKPDQY